ncbi:MAG TPA: GNAT family N-acetyltransferase [Usitatibacteraceae bacterium]
MIRIPGRAAIYAEVWYDEEPPDDAGADILVYRFRGAPIAAARNTPFLSIVTDLAPEQDAIMARFGKDCRYKIKRAEARDGLHAEFITDPERKLDEFCAAFTAFARQKSIAPPDHRWLIAASRARRLLLTAAVRDGEVLVWHAYVSSGKTVVLQYTCSCFRTRENEYRALVGRANRWLHWQDMLWFKQMGMVRYDWGGLFEDDSTAERAGINRFKEDFGGRRERSYDCTLALTLKGRIYLPLRDAWRNREHLFRRTLLLRHRITSNP